MGIKTEKRHAGEFLLVEADGTLSRENIVISSGSGVLPAGQVLGKITATGEYKAYSNAASDGSQTADAILYAGVDATSVDVPAVGICRLAEVNGRLLTGLDAAGQADLLAKHIVVR